MRTPGQRSYTRRTEHGREALAGAPIAGGGNEYLKRTVERPSIPPAGEGMGVKVENCAKSRTPRLRSPAYPSGGRRARSKTGRGGRGLLRESLDTLNPSFVVTYGSQGSELRPASHRGPRLAPRVRTTCRLSRLPRHCGTVPRTHDGLPAVYIFVPSGSADTPAVAANQEAWGPALWKRRRPIGGCTYLASAGRRIGFDE